MADFASSSESNTQSEHSSRQKTESLGSPVVQHVNLEETEVDDDDDVRNSDMIVEEVEVSALFLRLL
eukprot:Seg745.6 transcript_id=Seg745.6/GoldUCD/mRNA.D3Y31 product="hypothetical protein" protein_id=Seg745.6/GoldUCD/D3Y31